MDGVFKVWGGGDLRPVLVSVLLLSSCRQRSRVNKLVVQWNACFKLYVCSLQVSVLDISHLSQRQIWRWSCSWTSSPQVQTAAACDWLTVNLWVLLGCSSWQGGRGACPHTLRCHTSTHTYTCKNVMRRAYDNAYERRCEYAARSITGSLLPVFFAFHNARQSFTC